jgi:hypothetical protein
VSSAGGLSIWAGLWMASLPKPSTSQGHGQSDGRFRLRYLDATLGESFVLAPSASCDAQSWVRHSRTAASISAVRRDSGFIAPWDQTKRLTVIFLVA